MASTSLENGVEGLSIASDAKSHTKAAASDLPNHPSATFASTQYSPAEQDEVTHWTTAASKAEIKTPEGLTALNTHLSTRTTLIGSKPSVADVALYHALAPTIKSWSPEQRTGDQGHHAILRWADFVQSGPLFGLKLGQEDKIHIDPDSVIAHPKPIDHKAEKERKKKEKAASSSDNTLPTSKPESDKPKGLSNPAEAPPTSETKKDKKAKTPKPSKAAPAAAATERPLSPSLIDLRVGHILRAIPHPDADSLYVSTIACGDAPGTEHSSLDEATGQTVRTVCSGLNGLIPLAEMQGRRVVAVCNLKPVKMRGIVSAAMVLAASPRVKEGEDAHAGPVELVDPPAEAEAGERVYFEGWEGEPEPVLNAKKKIWEQCQVGFTTTEDRGVGFDVGAVEQLKESGKTGVAQLRTRQGLCKVKTLTGATVR